MRISTAATVAATARRRSARPGSSAHPPVARDARAAAGARKVHAHAQRKAAVRGRARAQQRAERR